MDSKVYADCKVDRYCRYLAIDTHPQMIANDSLCVGPHAEMHAHKLNNEIEHIAIEMAGILVLRIFLFI